MGHLNIRHEIIFALGMNERLYDTINKMYSKKKWEYYEASKPFRDDLIVKTFSAKMEEMIFKVAGIINHSYDHEESRESIIALIKTGYRPAYKYVQASVDFVNIYDFWEKGVTKKNMVEYEMFNQVFVLIYLATYFDKDYGFPSNVGELLDSHLVSLAEVAYYSSDESKKTRNLDYLKEHKDAYRNNKREILNGITPVSNTIDLFFNQFIGKETEIEMNGANGSYEEFRNIRTKVFKNGMSKYIGAYSGLLKSFGLNSDYITTDVKFSNKILDDILIQVMMFMDGNNLGDEYRDIFFISALNMYGLSEVYKSLREAYLEDSQEELFLENKRNKEAIIQEQKIFAEEKYVVLKELQDSQEKNSSYLDEIDALKKKLEKAEFQLSLYEEHSKELIALRDYAYKAVDDDYTKDIITTDEKINYLKDKKAVVFGGHPNFIQKIKDKLPNFTYRDTDTLNRSLELIKKKEYVFLQTCFFNHPYYYKVMSEIEKNENVQLIYLSGHDNVKITINEMYDKITKE